MPAANTLAGERSLAAMSSFDMNAPVSASGSFSLGFGATDGTERGVAMFLLGSILFLTLLEIGGFKTIAAVSVGKS